MTEKTTYTSDGKSPPSQFKLKVQSLRRRRSSQVQVEAFSAIGLVRRRNKKDAVEPRGTERETDSERERAREW